MADSTLKSRYGPEIPRQIAAMIQAVHPTFDQPAFLRDALAGYELLELMPRAHHIANGLRTHLPDHVPDALAILVRSLGPVSARMEGNGMAPFLYLPHVLYVARFGLDFFEESMHAQYELTQRFTAEFSLRAFVHRYPERTLARLHEWARDPSVHVRRLVSEGTRPRLPWAARLRTFEQDPTPMFALLERLRDDPEPYVRRSVANHLNDIGKDHPALLVQVCNRWLEPGNPQREALVRHALRTAIKRGDAGALTTLGFGKAAKIALTEVSLSPQRARINGAVQLSFTITSRARSRQSLLVDFRVHYVKADGGTSPKVFKLTSVELAAGETVTLRKKVSLRQMTTRRHYPGVHRVEVLVNGKAFDAGEFRLLTAKP